MLLRTECSRNLALLAGLDPQSLHEWYLAVYADACKWMELPNAVGMSPFAGLSSAY